MYAFTIQIGYNTRSIFLLECNNFEFKAFLHLDRLTNYGWRTQFALLYSHSRRENNWIHTFAKNISPMWNVNSIVQDLNSLPCPFPSTIIITPRTPLQYWLGVRFLSISIQLVGTEQMNSTSLFTFWAWQNFFSLEKKSIFGWRRCLSL